MTTPKVRELCRESLARRGVSLREYEREDGRRTVVWYDANHEQVSDAMPGDAPDGGGKWVSRATSAGIDYVAGWYSKGYADRVYRGLLREWDETSID